MARTGPPCGAGGQRDLDGRGRHRRRGDGDVVAVAAAPEQDDAATVAIPSPLMRTTLPGVAREMPRHPLRQVMASTTGRGAAADAAAAATGVCAGAAPPVPAGVWASARPAPGPRARTRRWQPTAGQRPGVGGSTQAGPRSVGRLRGELTGSRGRSALPGIRPGFAPGTHARVPVGPPLHRDRVGDRGRLGVSTEVGAGSYTRQRMSGSELRGGRRNPSRLPYHAPSRRADIPPRGFLTLS